MHAKNGGKASSGASFAWLATQTILLHTLSAHCHERILVDSSFNMPWFLTMLIASFNAMIAGVSRLRRPSPFFSGFVRAHAWCALSNCVTHGTSTIAFMHLNYTTGTLFRSSKVLFVMIGGIVMHSRAVRCAEWLAGTILFAGLALFGLADKATTPRFSVTGVVFTVFSLLCGSLCGNLQQRVLQECSIQPDVKQRKNDLLCFQYGISAACCVVICLVDGELWQGINYLSTASAWTCANMCAFLTCGFLGVQPLYTITSQFGATSAQIVTSLRKVTTFLASFLFFPKPFTIMHAIGAVTAVTAALGLQMLQEQKACFPVADMDRSRCIRACFCCGRSRCRTAPSPRVKDELLEL